jgi:hypothetical protein
MMKFNVTYEDGTTETYKVKPRHILNAERSGGGMASTVEATYKLAFAASGRDGDFDAWMESVDDIQPEVDGEAVLPTTGE